MNFFKKSSAAFHHLPPPSLSFQSGGSASPAPPPPPYLSASIHITLFPPFSLSPPSFPPTLFSHLFLSPPPSATSTHLLLSISSSCPNLQNLTFLTPPLPVSLLQSLPISFHNLNSLSISLSRPLDFDWLSHFKCLKLLSILFTGNDNNNNSIDEDNSLENLDGGLNLESLCLTGIKGGDFSLNWIWRNCKKIKTLKLKNCEGIGGTCSFSAFIKCLNDLQEVELRKSRTIVNVVVLNLVESCSSLNSLLVYDGGSRESLLQLLSQRGFDMRKIDLRLPLDLDNNHLIAMADNFRGLLSLRLESCCLVTGEGLKSVGRALGNSLEELALINCDVVDKEPGLLATLGQYLKRLQRLDLSYNEMLVDKEINSMLVSCNDLYELKLRGCTRLTNAATLSITKSCKQLQSVDIMFCSKIGVDAVELLLLNSPRLRQVGVEQNKLSDVARSRASNYFIKVAV